MKSVSIIAAVACAIAFVAPVSWGLSADLTNYHKEAGFPAVRTHDCVYAGQNVVQLVKLTCTR